MKRTLPSQSLIFSLALLTVAFALIGVIVQLALYSLHNATSDLGWNRALFFAESIIDKMRWCSTNSVFENCPTSMDFFDEQGQKIGEANVSGSALYQCSNLTLLTLTATGRDVVSGRERKLKVSLGKDTVARYSYLIDSNVWVGSDHQILGEYFSNGGVRMDGFNNSTVSSSVAEWVCTPSFGCSICPAGDSGCSVREGRCVCPGVFSTTQNSKPQLFEYPVTYFDFAGITQDFSTIKDKVISFPQDLYWPKASSLQPGAKGYHLVFKSNGNIEVRIVRRTRSVLAYSLEEGWHYDPFIIRSESFVKEISPQAGCQVVFIEDTVWLEGDIKGNVTIAVADLGSTRAPKVLLRGSLRYSGPQDSLLVLSEGDILITPDSPNIMTLNGVFVSQQGRFARNHYPFNYRDRLEIKGTIVSKGRVGTKWISGSYVVSGYRERITVIDPNLIENPPPFLPATSPEFRVLRWEELP